jgi:ATPase subunit of ABC transporter with duplicated ATPase domains
LEKLNIEEIQPSSRRYPGIIFQQEREAGNQVIEMVKLQSSSEEKLLFSNVEFQVNKGDKIALISDDSLAVKHLYEILAGERTPEKGEFKWGQTIKPAYLPSNNNKYFTDTLNLVDWLRQYSTDTDENYIRGFLGKMLFSGEDVFKKSSVLSGGEKVRCMLSRMMMASANVLLMEEPTGHLDLESITALNESLIDFKGTVIFTSQDHQFTQTIANRIVEITPKGVIDKMMTYDEYLEDANVQEMRMQMYK